ncbi:cell division protein ZapA [Treponema primitia]|uniref:cell division protein ZapA n=1 Tax=Treponema primitia TaxID=88058 RepID=UPI00397FB885
MPKSDLRIDILGTSFSITADEDPVYLGTLLNRYRQVIENTKKITGMEDPLKLSIIAGFLLCDDLQKLSDRNPRVRDALEAEQLTQELISRLDRALTLTIIPS